MRMNSERRDKFFGATIQEWVDKVPGELAIDAVGLWQIVSFGRDGFDLSGDELVDVVRRCLISLLAKGARPVVGATDYVHYWTLVNYGRTTEEIVDGVIDEWRSSGSEPGAGGVWFALPHIYNATRHSPDRTKRGLL